MQFRIRVPIVVGLLIATCLSLAFASLGFAQINVGYFPYRAPLEVVEPYYNSDRLMTGCFRDPGPCWLGQASFDLLMFDRSDADSRTIVTDGVGGGELLNTTDLGFPVTAAFRFNLVLAGDDGCDLVFNYLGSKLERSRNNTVATDRYDFFEFSPIIAESGTQFQTSYTSELNSVELNSRLRQWSWFAPMAGIRFIQLEDAFDRFADGTTDLQLSMTDNELWGFQVGGEALLWDGGGVRLQSTVKGGVFYNDLELNTGGGDITLTGPPITIVETSAKFSTENVAFFGEVNLELAYRIGPQFSIRVGYTAMWLDGVALAPDQHDDFFLQAGNGTFDFGTVMYHGSYIAAELTW